MKRPSFSEGVLVALIASVAGSMGHSMLPLMLGTSVATRVLVATLGMAYVLYLLSRSQERTGRVVTVAAWLSLAAVGWFLVTDTLLYVAIHLGMIWLVRSLYHQPGPLAALADLALNGFALMAGLWAYMHADSLLLGVWSFFLVQALFVVVPSVTGPDRQRDTTFDHQPDPFQAAHRSAEAALRRLSGQN